jgi:Schlafen group 3, DNA/RNA helicase domain
MQCKTACPLYPLKADIQGVQLECPLRPITDITRVRRTRPYISPSPAGGGTPPPSRFLGSTMTLNAFNFQIFTQVGFLGRIPAVHLGQYLDGTDFIRRFDIPQIQFRARDAHQFFGGPREIRLDCLSGFFFHRLLQFGDNSLDVFPPCAFAGVLSETRPIGIASDLCRLYRSERIGLVASSGASRLKPEGVNVHEKIDATYWFLNDKTDVLSSYYLEDPATEFDIQGPELDWVGVCWDADFRFADGRWSYHKFGGTSWRNVNNTFRRTYLTNA